MFIVDKKMLNRLLYCSSQNKISTSSITKKIMNLLDYSLSLRYLMFTPFELLTTRTEIIININYPLISNEPFPIRPNPSFFPSKLKIQIPHQHPTKIRQKPCISSQIPTPSPKHSQPPSTPITLSQKQPSNDHPATLPTATTTATNPETQHHRKREIKFKTID